MKRFTYILMLLSIFGLSACELLNPSTLEESGNITFNISIQTPPNTGTIFKSTFKAGDEMGIYAVRHETNVSGVLSPTENYIHNAKLVCTGSKWKATTALNYAEEGYELDFYAYYPYDPSAEDPTRLTFNVATDQSVAENFERSFLLSGTRKNVTKDTDVVLTMAHKLALVQIEVLPTFVDPFTPLSVSLQECTAGTVIGLNTEATSPASSQTKINMLRVETNPLAATYTYRALLPAQTIAAGKSLIQISQNKQQYNSALPEAVRFEAATGVAFGISLPAINQAVYIPAGTFLMGSPSTEPNKGASNESQHPVTLSQAFYIGKYPVTNAQYAAFLNKNEIKEDGIWKAGKYPNQKLVTASSGNNNWGMHYQSQQWMPVAGYEHYPAIQVSWYGASEYAEWIGGKLPTEAQWEYACRGDYTNKASERNTKPFAIGNGGSLYANEANFDGRYPFLLPGGEIENFAGDANHPNTLLSATSQIGKYEPNNYGLYDMHGNVWEWCSDWYDANYGLADATAPVTDPTGTASGAYRVRRGGCWHAGATLCRSAARGFITPNHLGHNTGFRVLLVSP